jgi:hypothetical protein
LIKIRAQLSEILKTVERLIRSLGNRRRRSPKKGQLDRKLLPSAQGIGASQEREEEELDRSHIIYSESGNTIDRLIQGLEHIPSPKRRRAWDYDRYPEI